MLGIGDKFPEFKLNAVSGNRSAENYNDADHDFTVVKSYELMDWSVIYFYPKDFTFICPTEIVAMDTLLQETDEVIGISGDNEYCKWAWKCEQGDHHPLYATRHPLAADCGLALARECGIVNEKEGVCYRATFILDPEGYIAHVSVNRDDTGRNAKEILRTLKALKSGGLTGCEWNPGDDFVA
tara:strand:+ start:396 stop:944 length:549 start_codon:yes stop_codon:yes gene_type:complete